MPKHLAISLNKPNLSVCGIYRPIVPFSIFTNIAKVNCKDCLDFFSVIKKGLK